MKKSVSILLMICFSCSVSHSQQWQPKDSLHDYCVVCNNQQHLIIKPPYTKKFKQELPFLLTSGLVLAGGILAQSLNKTENYTYDQLRNNPPDYRSLNKLDRSTVHNWSPTIDRTSDYVLYTVSILPAAFLSENHTGRDIKTLLIMYAEVFTLDYGLFTIAKFTANRPRPYVYNPDTTEVTIDTKLGGGNRLSFFSGHTSQTAAASFFFAKVISDYHPTLRPGVKLGMWIFAATAPAMNGYFRVRAGKHFPTDVITGYIAGAATGFLVPELHRTRKSKEQKATINIGMLPSENGMEMKFVYSF